MLRLTFRKESQKQISLISDSSESVKIMNISSMYSGTVEVSSRKWKENFLLANGKKTFFSYANENVGI